MSAERRIARDAQGNELSDLELIRRFLQYAPLEEPCPLCHAQRHEPCLTVSGTPASMPHPPRVDALDNWDIL
jgi:hypothetical protein